MNYIIDCRTQDKRNIIRRIGRLKTTRTIADGGTYWMDPDYSQIHIESTLREQDIDRWLWKHNFDYVGVVPASS